jgi:hypothetical protein
MVPLVTSWLLSQRWAWRGLERLNRTRRQYACLVFLIVLAAGAVLALENVSDGLARGLLAISLVLLSVPLILLASNRLAVPLNSHRFYVSVGALIAVIGCIALGCIELRGAVDPMASHHETAEHEMWFVLLAALVIGPALTAVTWPFRQMQGEVHIAPSSCKLVIAGERIKDLHKLRAKDKGKFCRLRGWKTELLGLYRSDEKPSSTRGRGMERGVVAEPVGNTEADWSSGVRSTVKLPPYEKAEFDHFCDVAKEPAEQSGLDDEERKIRSLIRSHMGVVLATPSLHSSAG